MLFRRIVFGFLISLARNPKVQQKTGEVAGKALRRARPSLIRASKRAGELTRKTKEKFFDTKNQN